MNQNNWPELNYEKFQSTAHLLHMCVQMIGKLKLNTPFEPHWANVALWLTARGLTTGLIPYPKNAFSIDLDFFEHRIVVKTTSGNEENFPLAPMSVSQLYDKFFAVLKKLEINLTINPMPQELTSPIPFDKDTQQRSYDKELAHSWWKILMSTYQVMQKYHALFDGETPPVGFMWGTFDLRDARYNGVMVPTTGVNSGYIRRNAMNEAQVEVGFWPGNEMYPKPAFYAFTYPQPEGIEKAKVMPEKAYWHVKMMEFVLDYDELLKSSDPEKALFDFFQSTYSVGTQLANWNKKLNTSGKPS